MADTNWHLNGSSGSVTVHTGVAGRASRAGHRLTIEMREWSAEVTWEGDEPTGLAATVSVDSLTVVSGAGGLTPMTAAERSVARGNALKSLDADKFGEISYVSHELTATADGFRADGSLTIHGRSRPRTIDLLVTDIDDRWEIAAETTISQKDFGIRPYSLMMGSLKVADEVRVVVGVSHAKQP